MTAGAASSGRAVVSCEQWLGSNAYAGMKALRRAGWAVQVVAELEYVPLRWRGHRMRTMGRALRRPAVREFNREVLRQAERTRAEFYLAFKGAYVMPETLRELRRQDVRTYCFYPDVSFRAHGPWLPLALLEYDWIFTAKSFGVDDLRQQLAVTRASVLLHGFDPDLHRPIELRSHDEARYGCDASFIGTWSPKKEALLATLAERRPALHLRVWGEQWHNARAASLARAIGGHEVTGEEYVRAIAASRVNLAILSERRDGASAGDQITSRTFHIPACGAFMLHERTSELLEIFCEGRDVGCFTGADELIDIIDRSLANEAQRRAIAERGRVLVTPKHSWDSRIEAILAHHRSEGGQ
ncbi:MAG: glycosyltransferase [Gemmatimonadota bacterium]|nr:glycosyltransferase [Gemmatimonadota bacterium]